MAVSAEAEIVGTYKDELTRNARRSFERFKRDATRALKIIGTAAAAAGAAGLVAATKAAMEQERQVRRLEQTLRSTGQFNRAFMRDLQNMASRFQSMSTVGDEAILNVQRRLIAFGAERDNIENVTQAVLDLSAGLGVDLNAASLLMGKALSGEFSTLSRYGIIVDENADKTEKLNNVMKQIEERFGGQAQAELELFSGQLQQLINLWGDLLEAIGAFVTQSEAGIKIIQLWKREISELIEALQIQQRLMQDPTLLKRYRDVGDEINVIRERMAELNRQSDAQLLFGDAAETARGKMIELQEQLIEKLEERRRIQEVLKNQKVEEVKQKRVELETTKKTTDEMERQAAASERLRENQRQFSAAQANQGLTSLFHQSNLQIPPAELFRRPNDGIQPIANAFAGPVADIMARLQQAQQDQLAPEEQLFERFQREREILEEHLADKLELRQVYKELERQLEEDAENELSEIRKRNMDEEKREQLEGQRQAIQAGFQLVSSLSALNQQVFNEQKEMAIALATMNAFLAAAQVLADPTVPTFWGKVAFYGKMLSIGLGLAAQIGGITKGGGAQGGVPTAGGFNAQPVTDVGGGQQGGGTTVILPDFDDDDLVSGAAVKRLFKRANEYTKNGGRILTR